MHVGVTAMATDSVLNCAVQAIAVTVQLSTPLSQHCHYHRSYTGSSCHCFDISVDSNVALV